jgi:hypothetical protein
MTTRQKIDKLFERGDDDTPPDAMHLMIDNYINGNHSDAKRQARRLNMSRIMSTLIDEYGYSEKKARLTACNMKGDSSVWQAACDAD